MAIMTGVQSAQVLGPTTQKQADKSRQSLEGVDEASFDASKNLDDVGSTGGRSRSADSDRGRSGSFGAHSDGGREEVERQNGIDVIK